MHSCTFSDHWATQVKTNPKSWITETFDVARDTFNCEQVNACLDYQYGFLTEKFFFLRKSCLMLRQPWACRELWWGWSSANPTTTSWSSSAASASPASPCTLSSHSGLLKMMQVLQFYLLLKFYPDIKMRFWNHDNKQESYFFGNVFFIWRVNLH